MNHSDDICEECGLENLIQTEDSWVCTKCALCCHPIIDNKASYRDREPSPAPFNFLRPPGYPIRGVRTSLKSEPYKRPYHFCERLALFYCNGPRIPMEVEDKMEEEYQRGKKIGLYPRSEFLLGRHVKNIFCRSGDIFYKGKPKKCRIWMERWKRALMYFRGYVDIPDEYLLPPLKDKFEVIDKLFDAQSIASRMPMSKLVKKLPSGIYKKTKKPRKNIINFNEIFRQLLYSLGASYFVPEFPPLKTPARRDVFIKNYKRILLYTNNWDYEKLVTVVL